MGHEYVGVVEEVGSEVRNVAPGDFVVGSFFASDNTCEICRAGYQSRCVNAEPMARSAPRHNSRVSPWPTAPSSRHPGCPTPT